MRTEMARRSFFAGIGLTVAAGSIGSASAFSVEPHADAALLALDTELASVWNRETIAMLDGPMPDDEADALVGRAAAIVERIIATPCRTLDGVRVKLRGLAWCHNGDLPASYVGERVVHSLASDLGILSAPPAGRA